MNPVEQYFEEQYQPFVGTQVMKGLGVCPSKRGLKELSVFSLERENMHGEGP